MNTRIVVAVLLAVLASTSLSAPSLARPNNGAYARSSEATKLKYDTCQGLKGSMRQDEKEADKRAGTPAAKKYADSADSTYGVAHDLGCPWAA